MIRLVPVVLPRAFLLHADHGCDRHPAFPAPSISGGTRLPHHSGAARREMRRRMRLFDRLNGRFVGAPRAGDGWRVLHLVQSPLTRGRLA
jgi:hypothetical protein